jgi:hypothetical protein
MRLRFDALFSPIFWDEVHPEFEGEEVAEYEADEGLSDDSDETE